MIAAEKHRYTVHDYYQLPEGSPYQLIEGEMVISPAPMLFHQDIAGRIYRSLCDFAEKKSLGKVFISPVDVELSEKNVFQPDIVFISNEHKHILTELRIKGAPDLVVEILSESTGYVDLIIKKKTYLAAGVKEYWIVDPMEKTIEVFESKEGKFVTVEKLESPGTISSILLKGFSLSHETVFEPVK